MFRGLGAIRNLQHTHDTKMTLNIKTKCCLLEKWIWGQKKDLTSLFYIWFELSFLRDASR